MINKILQGNSLEVLKTLDSESIDCIMTSPPYWGLRDYGVDGQLGLEPTFDEYINNLIAVFDECKRVLKKEGTCWVNLGDSYNTNHVTGTTDGKTGWKHGELAKDYQGRAGDSSIPTKCLLMIPSRFAIAMIDRGWILRNDIIWYKPNCMPESVKDRFTNDYEHLFFFVKQKKYYFKQVFEPQLQESFQCLQRGVSDHHKNLNVPGQPTHGMHKARARGEGEYLWNPKGRNKRTVWTIPTQPSPEAHFAIFPQELVRTPIDAGCPEKGTVLDPFCGTGTTCYVARGMGRNYIGIELNPEYIKMAEKKLAQYMLAL